MARIWPAYDRKEPATGCPWAEMPAFEAIALFELGAGDLVADLVVPPRFGNSDQTLSVRGHRQIVVEIGDREDRPSNWQPGFYSSRTSVRKAIALLIQRALVSALGDENVVRVELQPTTDSSGRDALGITVVIAPFATKRLKGKAIMDALASVRKQLEEMADERAPIIHFATEEELVQNASA